MTPELVVLAVLAKAKEPLAWFRIALQLSVEPLVERHDVQRVLESLRERGLVEEIEARWVSTKRGREELGDFRIPRPISEFERELRDRLPPEITVELSSAKYFSAISKRFPICFTTIDWRHVPSARVHVAPNHAIAERLVLDILDAERLDDALPVVCVSDSLLEGAYHMSIRTLRAHLGQVLEFPQHLYLLDPAADWCFAWTMLDDLCFGRPPIPTP